MVPWWSIPISFAVGFFSVIGGVVIAYKVIGDSYDPPAEEDDDDDNDVEPEQEKWINQ